MNRPMPLTVTAMTRIRQGVPSLTSPEDWRTNAPLEAFCAGAASVTADKCSPPLRWAFDSQTHIRGIRRWLCDKSISLPGPRREDRIRMTERLSTKMSKVFDMDDTSGGQ